MRGMSGGKLALGGWMQAVQDGNWIQPLGDSVRALNAGSGLVSWTGDGATAPTRLALRELRGSVTRSYRRPAPRCSRIQRQTRAN